TGAVSVPNCPGVWAGRGDGPAAVTTQPGLGAISLRHAAPTCSSLRMSAAPRGLGVARRLLSAGLQEGDHGEDAAVVVAGLGQVQLGEDGADVFFDGAL